MHLSWNEVRARAAAFAEENKGAHYEKGEAQTFYNEFFEIFGVKRKRVAVFEKQVKKLDNSGGFIDLFWPGTLVVEQKSAGRDLRKAQLQALDYCSGLKPSEHPRYILLCDFQRFELYDLDEGDECKFSLNDLPKHVEKFGFVLGREKRTFTDQPDVNIKASELMGAVHDALEASGYRGHNLERFLVRLLFCLFADDTGIFEPKGIFETWLCDRTNEDGSGLGAQLSELFQVLDTPEGDRQADLDEDLAQFPYINGDLFGESLRIPAFNSKMRTALLEASAFKWEAVSPAIFGSLFQSVMNSEERRSLGAHYTSEKNILKAIGPLFLDGLKDELSKIRGLKRGKSQALHSFLKKLAMIQIFDPACGCGNFLIIAYRQLRELELQAIRELHVSGQLQLDATELSNVNVDQFHGIELEEFPTRIAEVAMWMMDHIMNTRLGLEFGQVFARIPLTRSPNIHFCNALELDWATVLPAAKCSYIVGNPPFVGHQWRTPTQKADMQRVWGSEGQVNRLDYVTCWLKKSIDYAAPNKSIRIAFVATNSISQGEQASILWPPLFKAGASIFFAHRTFQWNSEARGKAAVHCVIVGLSLRPPSEGEIFDYSDIKGEPHRSVVSRINGYLIDGPDYALPHRTSSADGRLKMHKGSQPTDGARIKKPGGGYLTQSNLILDAAERKTLLSQDRKVAKWLKPYVGGDELVSGEWRWCLWLKKASAKDIKASKPLMQRLERVKAARKASPTPQVREYANYPTLFTQDRQPSTAYLALPEVSSQTREYIPMDILTPDVIASNKLQIIPGADELYFGVLTSAMHMAWMRTVGGRLKSDYSYSPSVYFTFPWPEMNKDQEREIRRLAKAVRSARARSAGSTLGDLYDADSMPPALRRAHVALDRAIDKLYRRKAFSSERERVEYLFELYEKRSAPLAVVGARAATRRPRRAAKT